MTSSMPQLHPSGYIIHVYVFNVCVLGKSFNLVMTASSVLQKLCVCIFFSFFARCINLLIFL